MNQPPAFGAALAAGRRQQGKGRFLYLLLGLLVLAGLGVLSITTGSRNVSRHDLAAALQGHTDNISQAAVNKRIPRTVIAILAGAALGVAGTAMQGVTRNPLADPGILGVNTGASLAVVAGISLFGLSMSHAYVWTAIIGAGLTAVFVYVIGSLGPGGATPLKLALAGTAVTVALTSFINVLILGRNDIAGGARSWMVGGVGGVTFDRILLILPFLVAGFLICYLAARSLNALALGDELATGLGENVLLSRGLASLGAVALCGAATAICGPVGFVGLAVPHACRTFIGVDHRWLLPMSAIAGAALLTAADILGRIIARPNELEVGIITAVVGAPIFIWIVRQRKTREL